MLRAISAVAIACLCAIGTAKADEVYGRGDLTGQVAAVHVRHHIDANGNRILIGGRPSGCPHAYCGCGLGRYLGKTDRRLWLAWNWAQMFQRVHARPGAVAVRHHHVMLLESQIAGMRWIVRDFNGGRHLSWIHERDVSGYVFVDPNARADIQ